MGHDIRVHREYYRLPEEIVQVAKVSKILLALEKGTLHLQTGKRLDDVHGDLEEEIDIDGEKSDSENEEEEKAMETGKKEKKKKINLRKQSLADTSDETDDYNDDILPRKKRSLPKRKTWTECEKSAVFHHFQTNICVKRLPGKRQIDACMDVEPVLQGRTWKNMKDFVRNQFRKKTS